MGGWVWGQIKVCVPKLGPSVLASIQNFIVAQTKMFLGFGWGGSLALGGGVQWVKLSVGHWRTAAHPLLCISVAHPQASLCLMFCDRKVPMVL